MFPLLNDFINLIKDTPGEVIEYGTGNGQSICYLASNLPNHKFVTVDWFKGLPSTEKQWPGNADWYEGQYAYVEEDTKSRISPFSNIELIVTKIDENTLLPEMHNLVGVNMDVDIYESSLDGLNLLKKFQWDSLIVRFDDWGGPQFPGIEQHEEASLLKFLEENPNIKSEQIRLDNPCNLVKLFKV